MNTTSFDVHCIVEIPQSYIIDKINSYSDKIRETSSYLNGCCPVCREGNSWGKKRRMFYFKNDDYIMCHNCSRSWSPYFWIKEVCDLSFKEMLADLKDSNYSVNYQLVNDVVMERTFDIPTLPGECVNLKDSLQVRYFNKFAVVGLAKEYCENRRLFTAAYAPKTFFCCINDKFHGNRLLIPYYNDNRIETYITRKLLDADIKPKYLIKFGSKKPIFNLHRIDESFPYIFIFEGQIDAMFVKNGIAVSGVHLTKDQEDVLTSRYPFHQKIWVLDNFRFEGKEVIEIIMKKISENETIFLYDEEFSEFKDINEYCVKKEQDFVDPALLLKYSYSGDSALLKLGD